MITHADIAEIWRQVALARIRANWYTGALQAQRNATITEDAAKVGLKSTRRW